ncbi:hypothetical protein BKA70DRAFT_1223754 [Coprinopsis sp. MPI-PUGE-AT-0042]|nr:hypothetical protein BKA70DRAFT_1223754 [Coprinopsis sp. MPI-PUGE-AT-0042]
MLAQITYLTFLTAFATLSVAQDENVVTLYAPSLEAAPSGQPLQWVDKTRHEDLLNDFFHLGGKIESVSAVGVSGEGTYYVGVHYYSVVPTTTRDLMMTTATLPTPFATMITFYASPSQLVYPKGGEHMQIGPNAAVTGDLEYVCNQEADKGEDGVVVCTKLFRPPVFTNGPSISTASGITLSATSTGPAVAIATITNDLDADLPTVTLGPSGFSTVIEEEPLEDTGSGHEKRVESVMLVASGLVYIICNLV